MVIWAVSAHITLLKPLRNRPAAGYPNRWDCCPGRHVAGICGFLLHVFEDLVAFLYPILALSAKVLKSGTESSIDIKRDLAENHQNSVEF